MGLIATLAERVNPAASQQTGRRKQEWPPEDEAPRIDAYKDYRHLYQGFHEMVVDHRHLAADYGVYLAVNLPSLVVKIPADLMFGEPVTIEYEDSAGESQQAVVEDIWERNQMQVRAYEQALDTGALGDGLWVVNRGEDGKAQIRGVDPSMWFPVSNPDDEHDIEMHQLAWKRVVTDGRGKKLSFLRVIEHHRGMVLHKLLRLEDDIITADLTNSDPMWKLLYPDGRPEDVETGIDEFLLVHVPNYRAGGQYHGRSDYAGMEALYGELDGRLTQACQILHRHSDPSWSLPKPMFDYLENKYKLENVEPEHMRFLMQDQDTVGGEAKRIVWDAHLSDNMAVIDELTNKILMLSEIDRSLVGRESIGAVSGRALRILLMRTLSKVGRKWMYQKPALEHLLDLAQRVEGVKDPAQLALRKSDGLPADVGEDADTSAVLVNAGLSSRVREIMKLHDVDRNTAEQILDEIDQEDDTARNSKALQGNMGRTPINVQVGQEEFV